MIISLPATSYVHARLHARTRAILQAEHCEDDWIGIVPDGSPPCRTAAVKWALLSEENEGVVEISHGPMYPGTYRAHLFLSEV